MVFVDNRPVDSRYTGLKYTYSLFTQFCVDQFGAQRMSVFASLFEDLLSPMAIVRFEQTRAQPLIPHNTLVMDNAFKTGCDSLMTHYRLNTEWKALCHSEKVTTKPTAKMVADALRECIPKLKERCASMMYTIPSKLIEVLMPVNTGNVAVDTVITMDDTNSLATALPNDEMSQMTRQMMGKCNWNEIVDPPDLPTNVMNHRMFTKPPTMPSNRMPVQNPNAIDQIPSNIPLPQYANNPNMEQMELVPQTPTTTSTAFRNFRPQYTPHHGPYRTDAVTVNPVTTQQNAIIPSPIRPVRVPQRMEREQSWPQHSFSTTSVQSLQRYHPYRRNRCRSYPPPTSPRLAGQYGQYGQCGQYGQYDHYGSHPLQPRPISLHRVEHGQLELKEDGGSADSASTCTMTHHIRTQNTSTSVPNPFSFPCSVPMCCSSATCSVPMCSENAMGTVPGTFPGTGTPSMYPAIPPVSDSMTISRSNPNMMPFDAVSSMYSSEPLHLPFDSSFHTLNVNDDRQTMVSGNTTSTNTIDSQ